MSDVDPNELAALRVMADEWACTRLHQKYLTSLGQRDRAAILSVFTDDASYGPAKGIEEIGQAVDEFWPLFDKLDPSHHIVPIPAAITVDGDTATADIYTIGLVPGPGPDGGRRVMVTGMGYRDDFVRTAEGWRIAAMRGIEGGYDLIHDTTWRFDADVNPASIRSMLAQPAEPPR